MTLFACPDCPPAREARHLFLHLDLIRNALFALAPFVVAIGLVILVVRSLSTRGTRSAHVDEQR